VRQPQTKGQQALGLRNISSPTERAQELLQQAQELGRQHLQMTEQSMEATMTHLNEIVGGGTLYSDGVKDRASKLHKHLAQELAALQNTQGWSVPPATTKPQPV
jgi:hypothetical protein